MFVPARGAYGSVPVTDDTFVRLDGEGGMTRRAVGMTSRTKLIAGVATGVVAITAAVALGCIVHAAPRR